MTSLQFAAAIVNSLAWPVAFVAAVALVRRGLTGVFQRAQSIEFPGGKATFATLMDFEKIVATAARDAGSLDDRTLARHEMTEFSVTEALASVAPGQAIIDAWGLVEYQLNVTSDRVAPDQPHGWPQVARNLEAWDKWPLLYPAVLELRRLRDYTVQSNEPPSSLAAARYVSVAQDLAVTLKASFNTDSVLVSTVRGNSGGAVRRIPASGGSEFTEPHSRASYTMPVTIYLSESEFHRQVEDAVEALLLEVGLGLTSRDDPVEGSWFRRMKASFSTPAMREGSLGALHIADSKLTLGSDAVITATLMGGISPVLTALQPTKDAVVRLGAVLIIKIDWVVSVNQLTAAQQAMLDHRPELSSAPHEIIQALQLPSPHADSAENAAPHKPEMR